MRKLLTTLATSLVCVVCAFSQTNVPMTGNCNVTYNSDGSTTLVCTLSTVVPPPSTQTVSVSISPTTPTVQINATQPFTATVTGTSNTAVTWSTSTGTISNTGLFTAPGSAGTATVTATSVASPSQYASTVVTVTGGGGSGGYGGMQQLASDNFSRANGALGVNWAPLAGELDSTLAISNQQVQSSNGGLAKDMYYGGINWPADQYSQAQVITASSGQGGPAVRMTSAGYHYAGHVFNLGTGNVFADIIRDTGNNYTVLNSTSTATVLSGDYIQLSVKGATLTLTDITQNTVLLTATDSAIPAGYPGISLNPEGNPSSVQVWANWSGGALTSALALNTIASDNFNRANAANLGTNWTAGSGHFDIQIAGDQIQPSTTPTGAANPALEYYSGTAFQSDQWSEGQIIATGVAGSGPDDNGAVLRYQGTADTYYLGDIQLTGGPEHCQTSIARVVNGTQTVLVQDPYFSVVGAGDIIRAQVQGSLISLIDVSSGALLLTAFDTNITGGSPGWLLNPTTSTPVAANWSGGGFQ